MFEPRPQIYSVMKVAGVVTLILLASLALVGAAKGKGVKGVSSGTSTQEDKDMAEAPDSKDQFEDELDKDDALGEPGDGDKKSEDGDKDGDESGDGDKDGDKDGDDDESAKAPKKKTFKNPKNTDPDMWFRPTKKDAKSLAEVAHNAMYGAYSDAVKEKLSDARETMQQEASVYQDEFMGSFGSFLPSDAARAAQWQQYRPGMIGFWEEQYRENMRRFTRWFLEHFLLLVSGFFARYGILLTHKKIDDDADKNKKKKGRKKDDDDRGSPSKRRKL